MSKFFTGRTATSAAGRARGRHLFRRAVSTDGKTAFASRFGVFKDADGFSAGTIRTSKVTLTADYKIRAGCWPRRVQHDCPTNVLLQEHGRVGNGQPTLMLGFVAYFAPKIGG
jgi:hypothetical protein